MALPPWARDLSEAFLAGTTSTFCVHGNVHDLVPTRGDDGRRYLGLAAFCDEVLFPGFDLVCHFDRGRGLELSYPSGDRALQDRAAELLRAVPARRITSPRLALEVIDRLLHEAIYTCRPPRKVAVIIRYAELVAPEAEVASLGAEAAEALVRLSAWAESPAILGQNIVVLLISERLSDLHRMLRENPHTEKLSIPLPDEAGLTAFIEDLAGEEPAVRDRSDLAPGPIARRLVGLSRVDVRDALFREVRNGRRLTEASLQGQKKTLLEAECGRLLEVIETDRTLDQIAGHDAAKRWLREDGELLRQGKLHALPMGYLLTGRIGTGKTFLITCWAGELGIPCVVLKNFRDRWVGATEGNLETIFSVLRALGQCVVFVDEADQVAGKRGGGSGDSGLSGRVYASLAKEMSRPENRGRIIWVFATSRPDLLEADLKRQGRLDVHIPLFAPQTQAERDALCRAIAARFDVPGDLFALPPVPGELDLGGNEIEGAIVRALRRHELALARGDDPRPFPDLLEEVFQTLRPSAEGRKLRFMDLVAARECTDSTFLPPRFRALSEKDLERQLRLLLAGPAPSAAHLLAEGDTEGEAAML